MLVLRRVVGQSMLPSLREGQVVVGWKFFKPEVGCVVIAKQSGREVIKRIKRIDNGKIWLEGDNKEQSTDSRQHGYVSPKSLRAVVIYPFKFHKKFLSFFATSPSKNRWLK